MQKSISEQDLERVRKIFYDEISKKWKVSKSQDSFAFGAEFIELIVSKVMIPIIVSLASKMLYDYLKGRKLDSLSKKETEKISNKFIGIQVNIKSQLDSHSLEELRIQLCPLGFTENEIESIFEKTKKRLIQP